MYVSARPTLQSQGCQRVSRLSHGFPAQRNVKLTHTRRHLPVMRARYCNTARVSDGRQERTGQHSQERSVMVGETPHMDIAVVDVVLIPAQAHCVSHAATPFQGL